MYTCSSVIRSCFPPSSWLRADDERSASRLLTLSSSPTPVRETPPPPSLRLSLFLHPSFLPFPFSPIVSNFENFSPVSIQVKKKKKKKEPLQKLVHTPPFPISNSNKKQLLIQFPVFPLILDQLRMEASRFRRGEAGKPVLPKLETRASFSPPLSFPSLPSHRGRKWVVGNLARKFCV